MGYRPKQQTHQFLILICNSIRRRQDIVSLRKNVYGDTSDCIDSSQVPASCKPLIELHQLLFNNRAPRISHGKTGAGADVADITYMIVQPFKLEKQRPD